MFDDADTRDRSRRDAACIRLNLEHWDWCRALVLLEARGGRRIPPDRGIIYRFHTSAARDDALDLLRGKYGRTIATPFDGLPWLRRVTAARDRPASVAKIVGL